MTSDTRRVDRRVGRTRELLQRAHFALILEKGYERTTVEDICAAANVGRSTFYAHFTGKDDLRRSGLDHLKSELESAQRNAMAGAGARLRFGFTRTLFEHAQAHRELYRALAGGRGGEVALDTIRRMLAELVGRELTVVEGVPRDLAIAHLVGALMSVLTWWLDRGAKLPPADVDAAFRTLALGGPFAAPRD